MVEDDDAYKKLKLERTKEKLMPTVTQNTNVCDIFQIMDIVKDKVSTIRYLREVNLQSLKE